MFYTGKVKYYNDTDDITEEYGIFVDADTYADAVNKIVRHYGENEMVGFSLEPFSPSSVLEFDDTDQFDYVCKSLEKNILW